MQTHVTPHIKAQSPGIERAGLSLPALCEWENPGLCLFWSLLAFDHEADAYCIKKAAILAGTLPPPQLLSQAALPREGDGGLEGRFTSLAHLD